MNVPKLRFPEFEGKWEMHLVGSVLERSGEAVSVEPSQSYRQIGVRSHGRGVFHKDAVTGEELGGKRVFHVVPNAFVVNIVFAWEQAVALTTDDEQGFIASHRFPMFLEKDEKSFLPFIRELFLRKRGKQLLELASPGGAGRNKTLGQQEFLKLSVLLPKRDEQKKIAAFLGVVDAKIAALRARRDGLERYKRGLMQALFSQTLRFTKADGTAFPDWEERRLGDFLVLSRQRVDATTDVPVYSSARDGLKPQKDYFADRELSNEGEYGIVPPGYIVYRHMSDDLTFKFNLNDLGYNIAVSKEYPVFKTKGMDVRYLRMWLNNSGQFTRFAAMQKLGGTRTRLYFKVLANWWVFLPHPDEQKEIADALSAMDAKIAAVADQVAQTEAFKKGLLQQMFV